MLYCFIYGVCVYLEKLAKLSENSEQLDRDICWCPGFMEAFIPGYLQLSCVARFVHFFADSHTGQSSAELPSPINVYLSLCVSFYIVPSL